MAPTGRILSWNLLSGDNYRIDFYITGSVADFAVFGTGNAGIGCRTL